MRPTLVALTLTVLSLAGWSAAPAAAQDAKVARGTIASITGGSLTLRVGESDMMFHVDRKTVVEARGASTKAARAAAAGKTGVHLGDLLLVGQAVSVSYNETSAGLHATEIKSMPKPASDGAKPDAKSTGVVKAVGPNSITLRGRSGGGASFEQTVTIDAATKVYGKGMGTMAASNGGTVPWTGLVSNGDHVSVWYHKQGAALIASEVRVTVKATH